MRSTLQVVGLKKNPNYFSNELYKVFSMVALTFRHFSANSGGNSPRPGSPEVLASEFSPCPGIHALVVNPHTFSAQEFVLGIALTQM